jgi:hypothetical protein
MSGIHRFEDIEAWQKARELTTAMYLSNDGQFARDFGLRDQIRRASVSIMSNRTLWLNESATPGGRP